MLQHLLKILELDGSAVYCLVKEPLLRIDYTVELEIMSELYFEALSKK